MNYGTTSWMNQKNLEYYPLLPENRDTYRLYVGPAPYSADKDLREKEIKTAVVLLETKDWFERLYTRLNIDIIHFPIKDFNVPESSDAVSELVLKVTEALERGNVFMHCHGGKGRTGTIAACLKITMDPTVKTALEAIQYTKRIVPGAIENKLQEKFVTDYFAHVRAPNLPPPTELIERPGSPTKSDLFVTVPVSEEEGASESLENISTANKCYLCLVTIVAACLIKIAKKS